MLALPSQARELYLITGTTTEKRNDDYASTLLRVNPDGSADQVEVLMDPGVEWIGVSHQHRKAVLLPKPYKNLYKNEIVVLDFDRAAAVKRCKIPDPGVPGLVDASLISQWLMDVPGRGLFFQQYLVGNGSREIQSMAVDPILPCKHSFGIAAQAERKHIILGGAAGTFGMISPDSLIGEIGEGGPGNISVRAGIPVLLSYKVPVALLSDPESDVLVVTINNSSMLVVAVNSLVDGKVIRPPDRLICRKKDNRWRVIAFPGEYHSVRALGRFVGAVESYRRTKASQQHAGWAEWRKERTATGPNQEEWFQEEDQELVYPGRLHLYDSETDQRIRGHPLRSNHQSCKTQLLH